MTEQGGFDPAVLQRLVEDTDSPAFVLELAETYCRLLPGRLERIVAAVASVDLDGGRAELLDATRSLRGASLMTGAVELADLAAALQRAVEEGDHAARASYVAQLPVAAARTRARMDAVTGALAS